MKLRKLTSKGIAKFAEYLDLLETEPKRLAPEILEHADYSDSIEGDVYIEQKNFGSRYAAAEYLYNHSSEFSVGNQAG